MVRILEPQTFEVELQSSSQPFLVAFLKRNDRYAIQSKVLDKASQQHRDKVRCFLYNADYLDIAMQQFMVKGTPTYLLFSGGREVDRLIGEPDSETLEDFIVSSVGNI